MQTQVSQLSAPLPCVVAGDGTQRGRSPNADSGDGARMQIRGKKVRSQQENHISLPNADTAMGLSAKRVRSQQAQYTIFKYVNIVCIIQVHTTAAIHVCNAQF